MSKEWKRAIAILVFVGGLLVLVVLLGILDLRESTERYHRAKKPGPGVDTIGTRPGTSR